MGAHAFASLVRPPSPCSILFHILPILAIIGTPVSGVTEAEALLKFRSALTNKEAIPNWNLSTTPCSNGKWLGVICEYGVVWGLQLENMGLGGTIDIDALAQLPELKTLSIKNNKFDSPIPDFDRLPKLRSVYLTNNKFSGEIPDNAFVGMHAMRRVILSNNAFTGKIPSSLTGLPILVELKLDGNQFQGSIPNFQQKELQSVNVANNQLEGPIPAKLYILQVEVLSSIRHPNMVLLLGACPEYGCIVYEYMANGSLDDRLFCRGNTPPLTWQARFRIAADIATGLNFLHQTKPEPLVHRDLKPGNILLDRYYVAKIGDVGLARLVPPSVADNITQYCMTSAAGTFCYIDPEYQQTGMLGVKSDVYSLGVVLLQLLTAKPPMGLTHLVEHFIEKGAFANILDQSVPDWPVEKALDLAKIAIQCAELRRKDRPDLGKVVLPEIEKLRDFADESSHHFMLINQSEPSPDHSQTSISQVSSEDTFSVVTT